MINEKQFLEERIPYMMHAVGVFNYALRLRSEWTAAPSMQMFVEGKMVIDGNLNAFTNPAIEAGLIHCRALLEFLGLCEKHGALENKPQRRGDDIRVEHFNDKCGNPLKAVTPENALRLYSGSQEDAEKALLLIFRYANKGLAHMTQDLCKHPEDGFLLEIASRGIPTLVINYLYDPLGAPRPDYKVTSRPKGDDD